MRSPSRLCTNMHAHVLCHATCRLACLERTDTCRILRLSSLSPPSSYYSKSATARLYGLERLHDYLSIKALASLATRHWRLLCRTLWGCSGTDRLLLLRSPSPCPSKQICFLCRASPARRKQSILEKNAQSNPNTNES